MNKTVIFHDELKIVEKVILNSIYSGPDVKYIKFDQNSFKDIEIDENFCVVLSLNDPRSISTCINNFYQKNITIKTTRPLFYIHNDSNFKYQANLIKINCFLSQRISVRSLSNFILSNSLQKIENSMFKNFKFDTKCPKKLSLLNIFSITLFSSDYKTFEQFLNSYKEVLSEESSLPLDVFEYMRKFCSIEQLHFNLNNYLINSKFSVEETADILLSFKTMIFLTLGLQVHKINMFVSHYVFLCSKYDNRGIYINHYKKLLKQCDEVTAFCHTTVTYAISRTFDNNLYYKFAQDNIKKPSNKIETRYYNELQKLNSAIDSLNAQNKSSIKSKSEIYDIFTKTLSQK